MARERASGTWVVTGAASGFGREFARRLAARGQSLSLWDRDAEGLERTRAILGSGARVHTTTVDVADTASVARAAESARREAGPIAHLVNSAGILRVGPAVEMNAADYRAMIDVNYLGSVHVASALLGDLRAAASPKRRAILLLVASVAGLRGFPELAGYCASKFAVLGFAQALRDEVAGTGVDVRVLCPPPGDTPMVRNLPYVPKIYELSPSLRAEEVVSGALAGLDRREFVILLDVRSRAMSLVNRVAPALMDGIVQRTIRR
jgi:short-subunit dehydrogenase